jgi:replicative DNA helicase
MARTLRPEDYYRDRHRVIYTAMLDLADRGEPVDLVTVTNKLSSMGKLDDVGGASYLAELPNFVPTSAHAGSYAEIVRDKAVQRSFIAIGAQMVAAGYEGRTPPTRSLRRRSRISVRCGTRGRSGCVPSGSRRSSLRCSRGTPRSPAVL